MLILANFSHPSNVLNYNEWEEGTEEPCLQTSLRPGLTEGGSKLITGFKGSMEDE